MYVNIINYLKMISYLRSYVDYIYGAITTTKII